MIVFDKDLCPSCGHPKHVGAVCCAVVNDQHDSGLYTCGCTPEKAIKADDGKASRWDLFAWDAVPEVLEVYRYGLKKGYEEHSWRKVEPKRYADALMRHMTAALRGEERDPESGLRHIAHVAWNALALVILWRPGAG